MRRMREGRRKKRESESGSRLKKYAETTYSYIQTNRYSTFMFHLSKQTNRETHKRETNTRYKHASISEQMGREADRKTGTPIMLY